MNIIQLNKAVYKQKYSKLQSLIQQLCLLSKMFFFFKEKTSSVLEQDPIIPTHYYNHRFMQLYKS